MNGFLLLNLVLCVLSQTTYTPVNNFDNYEHCKTLTIDATGTIKGCTACYTGYKLQSGKCVFDTTSCSSYPANGANADSTGCKFSTIGFDTAANKCSVAINVIDGSGKTYPTENTCLACAQYSSDNKKCEVCAKGYLKNADGKCVAVASGVFGDKTETTEHCYVGQYTTEAQCEGCSNKYYYDEKVCKATENAATIIEGCIESVVTAGKKLQCNKCRHGFYFDGEKCIDASETPELCSKVKADGSCERCLDGYYLQGTRCSKCTPTQTPLVFTGDECNALDTNQCIQCNRNCKIDDVTYACVSKHCDLFDSSNVCVRCEQGYVLKSGECKPCTNDCFTTSAKTVCESGYYLASNGGKKYCRKCEGKCKQCYSADVCVDGAIAVDRPTARNGMPCADPNCAKCSFDSNVCYECDSTKNVKLVGGKCYPIFTNNYGVNVANPLAVCMSYRQPDFITTKNVAVSYDGNYVRTIEPAYLKGVNKISGTSNYYCEYHDNLPYYYRHYAGEGITCAGANRDPTNDCECKVGYYPENNYKYSNCKKFDDPLCEKPLSDSVCGKCKEGLVLIQYKEGSEVKYQCGCPDGERPNSNGVCQPCTKECKTCRSDYTKNFAEVCLSCNGRGANVALIENNYNRNPATKCQCIANHAAKEDESIVYACYEIPDGCESDYTATENTVRCNECEQEGFEPLSGCQECSDGYYKKGSTCKKCPVAANDETYCLSCQEGSGSNTVECLKCVDSNMDYDSQCKKCHTGYSLKYKEYEGKAIPFCLQCNSNCKVDGGEGCFLADPADLKVDNFETYKSGGSITKPYTTEQIDTWQVYCDDCGSEEQSPITDCKCGLEYYGVGTQCVLCTEGMGDVEVEFMGETDDVKVTKKLSDICDLDNLNEASCVNSTSNAKVLQCGVCNTGYESRTPGSNCTECKNSDEYPVERGNVKCVKCPSICTSCTDSQTCKTCKAAYATGDKCDKCISGYFISKTEGDIITCEKCAEGCSSCSGKSTNCQECTSSSHIPNGEDGACNACKDEYYFNIVTKDCIQVSSQYGFLRSTAVCLNGEGNEIPCTEDQIPNIVEVIERPLRCNLNAAEGIDEYPVDGRCICRKGYIDMRTEEEKEKSPLPVCTDIRDATKQDFCSDGELIDGAFKCTECNAEYLDLVNNECKCKNTYYATSWGMCVPCDRHNKGCDTCTAKDKCTKCKRGYSLTTEDPETGAIGCK